MRTRCRNALICASLLALAAPASAAAGTGQVAPPGAGDERSLSAAVQTAANPGCRSRNVIAFKGPDTGPSRVRHGGKVRCRNIRVSIRCNANLLQGQERISSVRARGSNRCQTGTAFADSERYPAGTPFRQNYRYKLTLKNRNLKWSGTTDDCPRRSNNLRTLTCRGSHATVAPKGSVDRIRS